MKNLRTVIVDDEITAIEGLRAILKLFDEKLEIVGTAESVTEAIETIKSTEPDLVFLDVQLNDGLGIDVLSHFKERNFKTVFITAYDSYAIKAIKLRAEDYLLKPVNPNELKAAIGRVKLHVERKRRDLMSRGRFSVPSQSGSLIIESDQVIRLASDNNYTRIILSNGKRIMVSKTLKKFEETLDRATFLRVHAGHIVNFNKVCEYSRREGGWLIMANGDEIPVSKKHKISLEEALQEYLLRI